MAAVCGGLPARASGPVQAASSADLSGLSIEDLANIDISSVSKADQLSVSGFNLLHARHPEFGEVTSRVQLGAIGVETGRSVVADARWRF